MCYEYNYTNLDTNLHNTHQPTYLGSLLSDIRSASSAWTAEYTCLFTFLQAQHRSQFTQHKYSHQLSLLYDISTSHSTQTYLAIYLFICSLV